MYVKGRFLNFSMEVHELKQASKLKLEMFSDPTKKHTKSTRGLGIEQSGNRKLTSHDKEKL